ncbi:MAG TPA: NAD-dependent epimerase/dehydratase family protein [Chloroflexota bacterium]|nr:NAD-dependent epimerase/dehydratase family protein [Chloroflexota bacterium]
MRVVVTGGAGFIGSNVAAHYLREGHRVTVLDDLSRAGAHLNLPWLRSLDQHGRLRFVRGDVRRPEMVESALSRGADLLFHYAAQTAVTTSLTAPREDLDVNLMGTFNVLEAVRRIPPDDRPAVFFTSTNKVYGSLPGRKVVEDETRYRFSDRELDAHGIDESEPLDFHSPYGCSKGAADQYVRDYARIYGLRTVVFRMSCIYGTRQFGTEDQGWVAHFFIKAAGGEPIAIYGDGKQVRDLLFIDDLVRAFAMAAERIDATAGNVYNIGGGPANTVSIWRELQPRLTRLAGGAVPISRHDWRPGDQPVYVSNTQAARRDFGWAPRVDLDEGLSRLWRWVNEEMAALTPPKPPQLASEHPRQVESLRTAPSEAVHGDAA